MPLHRKADSKGPYYQWNLNGQKYYYSSGNTTSRNNAKRRALKSQKKSQKNKQLSGGHSRQKIRSRLRSKSRSRSRSRSKSLRSRYYRPTHKGAGMTRAGVLAYRRSHPNSRLQTAVTERTPRSQSRAKRRKLYCARSAGQAQKFNINCRKTPNKRLCQARRRWRC